MRWRQEKVLIIISAFVVVLIAAASGFLYEYTQGHNPLPTIPSHMDIADQPMQTFEQSLTTKIPTDISAYKDSTCTKLSPIWITDENLQQGVNMTVKDWKNLDLLDAQGSGLWLNKTSGGCGDTLDIHASLYGSKADNFHAGARSIQALRIGWYQGSGARQVWDSGPINLKERKINYPHNATRMIETKWPTTVRLKLDQNWIPGFYLFITRSPEGIIENTAPFILHSPLASSKLMIMHSFLTWNTYNSFGGRSGYFGAGATKTEQRGDRSRVVSLDRPIVGSGAFSIYRDAVSLVQFMEKNGINYDQYSDLDLDSQPSITQSYNGIVLGGHPEYFTRRIYDTLISARNTGINIAILGGNTGIWQTRLASSKVGKNRRIIIYRIAAQDPITNLRQVTIKYEDRRLNIPPTLLTGSLADGVHVYGEMKAMTIPKWLKLDHNASITGISPDSEVEHAVSTPAAPSSVNILFSGIMHYRDAPQVGLATRPVPVAQSIWFTTPSGAAIFNAGINFWSCDLTETCAYSTISAASRATIVSVTTQILKLWSIKAVGKTLSN